MVDGWNSRGKKGNSCPLLQLTMTAIQNHRVGTSAPCRFGCSHFVADCKFHRSGSSACGMVLPGCTSCSDGTFHNYIKKSIHQNQYFCKNSNPIHELMSPKYPLLSRPKLHHYIYKTLPLPPTLIHMKPVHLHLQKNFLQINFNKTFMKRQAIPSVNHMWEKF